MQFFVSKYLHSIVEGRPPYHPPLGRHPFPGLYKKTIIVDIVVVVVERKKTQLLHHEIRLNVDIRLNVLHFRPNHHACPCSKCLPILHVYVVNSPPANLIIPTALG